MIIELSVEGPALDWYVQIIQPHMMTMTWAQFRERFMRKFCPEPLRMSHRLRLTSITRGDRSVKEYTSEFLKLGRYAENLMCNQYFAVTIYVTGLGSVFACIATADLTLESVIELAREIELRLVRQGVMPDFSQIGCVRIGGFQSTP